MTPPGACRTRTGGSVSVPRRTLVAFLLLALTPFAAGGVRADAAEAVFSAAEKTIIAHYYDDGRGGQAAGRGAKGPAGEKRARRSAGNRGLPPGLAKRQRLPPGIAKRRLPADLARSLPPPPAGFERAVIDDNIVLVEIATQIVHDVLTHIATK